MKNKRMIYKTVLATITFSLLSLSITPEATAQAAGQSHTVQQGETLFSISRLYDVTVGDLRRWNRLQSDDLNPGQELLVGPPRNENSIIHTVQSGQTLFAISRVYDVTIAEIQSWNNLEGIQLSEGQELIIFQDQQEDRSDPDDLSAQSANTESRESIIRDREGTRGTTYYTVRSGDTLTRIARMHEMTVEQLRKLNNLQSDMLSIGQRLTVRDVQTAPSIAESAEESTPQGKFVNYRLEPGETAEDLKDKFLMNEDELAALNPDLDIESLRAGERITVLLPPSRNFSNPFKKGASLENLGQIPASRYSDSDRANPTTSGELYNPDYLTAGHSNMPLGNVIYLENPETGQGVYVRINDRTSGSGIQLSHKAFEMLGFSSIQRSSVVVYLDQ